MHCAIVACVLRRLDVLAVVVAVDVIVAEGDGTFLRFDDKCSRIYPMHSMAPPRLRVRPNVECKRTFI